MEGFSGDERAVSEAAGVAILVGITIFVTATVGLNVVLTSDDGPEGVHANFSYDYIDSNDALIITHVKGDEFPADELVVQGPGGETTWAAAANVNDSESIGPGDTIQISKRNSYGARVGSSSRIQIYHVVQGNRTRLSEWNGPKADSG